jgi:heme o synthase
LNAVFVALAFAVWRNPAVDADAMKPEKRLFAWSILYLFILFAAFAIDHMVLA